MHEQTQLLADISVAQEGILRYTGVTDGTGSGLRAPVSTVIGATGVHEAWISTPCPAELRLLRDAGVSVACKPH